MQLTPTKLNAPSDHVPNQEIKFCVHSMIIQYSMMGRAVISNCDSRVLWWWNSFVEELTYRWLAKFSAKVQHGVVQVDNSNLLILAGSWDRSRECRRFWPVWTLQGELAQLYHSFIFWAFLALDLRSTIWCCCFKLLWFFHIVLLVVFASPYFSPTAACFFTLQSPKWQPTLSFSNIDLLSFFTPLWRRWKRFHTVETKVIVSGALAQMCHNMCWIC